MILSYETFFKDAITEYAVGTGEQRFCAAADVWEKYKAYYKREIKILHPAFSDSDLTVEFFKYMYAKDFSKEENIKICDSIKNCNDKY